MEIKPNKTGICLGGGGALGFAHIGVLEALEEHSVFPYHVSGASMGAIIGVMYAAGFAPAQIAQIVEEHKLYNLSKIISPVEMGLTAGLSGHKSIEKLLRNYLKDNTFEGLQRRFSLSVVDLRRGEAKIISSGGKLIEHVLASMSIPLAFEPVTIGHSVYVDGGMMNNLPVEPLLPLCRKVIGVDVQTAHPFAGKITRSNIFPITYRLIQKQMNAERVARCDFYLSFPELDDYGVSDFNRFEEIRRIGYRGAKAYIATNPDIADPAKPSGLRRLISR